MTHRIHSIVLGKIRVGGCASERHTQCTILPCKMLLLLQFSFALPFWKVMFPPILAAPFAFLLFTLNWDFHFYLPFVTCFHSRTWCLSCSLPFLHLALKWRHHAMGTVPCIFLPSCQALSQFNDIRSLNHCQESWDIPHTFAMETPSWLMVSQIKAFYIRS